MKETAVTAERFAPAPIKKTADNKSYQHKDWNSKACIAADFHLEINRIRFLFGCKTTGPRTFFDLISDKTTHTAFADLILQADRITRNKQSHDNGGHQEPRFAP